MVDGSLDTGLAISDVTGAECGRAMVGHTVAPKSRKRGPYHYYLCTREVEEQVRAERESKPWLRDAREAASTRERLVKLEIMEDNYRDQQAEGLITMAKLREKLDGVREEREGLAARLAMLADGESRLRELEELSALLEDYLKDLPYLMDQMPIIREYETISAERTPENPLGIYTLTPDRIRLLSEEEAAKWRRAAEAARGARFRGLYAMLGLRAAIHADGTLEIAVGATREVTKGVMPCDGLS
jgi:hypothetical protein